MRFVLAFLLVAFAIQPVFANPPKSVDVTLANQGVNIVVVHPVKDPNEHFINKISATLNGKPLMEQTYSAQDGDKQVAFYSAPFLKKGDKIKVTAYCNKSGKKSKKIKVQ